MNDKAVESNATHTLEAPTDEFDFVLPRLDSPLSVQPCAITVRANLPFHVSIFENCLNDVCAHTRSASFHHFFSSSLEPLID